MRFQGCHRYAQLGRHAFHICSINDDRQYPALGWSKAIQLAEILEPATYIERRIAKNQQGRRPARNYLGEPVLARHRDHLDNDRGPPLRLDANVATKSLASVRQADRLFQLSVDVGSDAQQPALALLDAKL